MSLVQMTENKRLALIILGIAILGFALFAIIVLAVDESLFFDIFGYGGEFIIFGIGAPMVLGALILIYLIKNKCKKGETPNANGICTYHKGGK